MSIFRCRWQRRLDWRAGRKFSGNCWSGVNYAWCDLRFQPPAKIGRSQRSVKVGFDTLSWASHPSESGNSPLKSGLSLHLPAGHHEIIGLGRSVRRRSYSASGVALALKQASWESSWAAWTLPLEFRPEISAPASRMASMTCLWAAGPRRHVAEWFLNPFLARASDTASVHCARPKPHGHYPLALTGAICRIRSHVAKKSFNQLLYPSIR